MTSPRPMALLMVACGASLVFAGCDDFDPALGVGLTGDGKPVVYPVLCEDEAAVAAEIHDLGVTNWDDIHGDGHLLWRTESLSRPDGSGLLVAGEPPATFTEPVPLSEDISVLSANRWLRVRLWVQRGSRTIEYEEDYEAGDFEEGLVYAYWEGLTTPAEWQQAQQDHICRKGFPGIVPWLRETWGIPTAISIVFVGSGFAGSMFGLAWLGKRLGQPKVAKSGPPTGRGPNA